jgi:hypothetical protein
MEGRKLFSLARELSGKRVAAVASVMLYFGQGKRC